MTKLVAEVLEKNNLPTAIFTVFCGGAEIGQAISKDTRIPLVSFDNYDYHSKSTKKVTSIHSHM